MCCRDLSCPLPPLQAFLSFIILQPFLWRHVPEAVQHFHLFARTSLPICSSAVPSWSPESFFANLLCCQKYLPFSAWFPLHSFPHAIDAYFLSLCLPCGDSQESLILPAQVMVLVLYNCGALGLYQLCPQNRRQDSGVWFTEWQ